MPVVTVEHCPPVAILRLDDGKANAFNPTTLAAIVAALDEIEQSDARALVVAGRAGFFSGGLDLKALPTLPTAEKREVLRVFGEVLLRIFSFRVPTVAAVTGHAIAGGALLALSCDVRHGVDSPYRYGITEVALGLPVPSFGVLLARAALPPVQLTELLWHATTIDHREAQARGVFRAVHAAEGLMPAALACGELLAKLDGPAYAATKQLTWGHEIARLRAGFAQEVIDFIELFEGKFPGAR
jgi:enoyl-CoA hydratase